jgi:hypothetical protein
MPREAQELGPERHRQLAARESEELRSRLVQENLASFDRGQAKLARLRHPAARAVAGVQQVDDHRARRHAVER